MQLRATIATLALALLPAGARAAVHVVTTTQGLGALAGEVGGDRVEVIYLSRGSQDPHFVDANPNLAVKLRQADLLIDVGLDLEVGWLPPLVNQSRNAEIQPGGRRRLTAAASVQVLDVPTGPVDRSQGDIHPGGNPHFLTDPRRAEQVAAAIAARLALLDPAGADLYTRQLAAFRAKLGAAEARWQKALQPFEGKRIIVRHRTLTYFADWAKLQVAGYLEPKPGIEPPPSHLAELVQLAKSVAVKAVVYEGYYDGRSAELLARLTGARAVAIPGDVGATKEATTYEAYVDQLVRDITGALRS